ncbi:hypothetical protein ID866_9335 [Astraeus odoratus]|nr:hypothetical protein ID866_9335 [Astraeus odoratus]
MSSSISKIAAERNLATLMELVCKPGNDVCADCKARAPRWASYNLGIFICVNCASIHRKIGTHITKVKSLRLDEWSKEQVEFMKRNGNVRSNQLYNPDEARHPPPTNMIETERDSELERFIRAKYEMKRFMAKKPSSAYQNNMVIPPPRTASASANLSRPKSTPISTSAATIERKTSPAPPPLPEKTPQNMPRGIFSSGTGTLPHSSSVPVPAASSSVLSRPVSQRACAASQPLPSNSQTANSGKGGVWDELISLQGPTQNSSLPLQFQSSYSPSVSVSPLPTSAPSLAMTPTGMSSLQTRVPMQSIDIPQNPFFNPVAGSMVGTTAAATTGLYTPGATLATANVSTNPFGQQVGFVNQSLFPSSPVSTHPTGTAFPISSSPFPSPGMGIGTASPDALAIGMTPAQQPVGYNLFQAHSTPLLSPNPTGVFSPQGQLSAASTTSVPGGVPAPHTPSPFSTPFLTGSALPQQQQPFPASPQSMFGTTPFVQQQQSPFQSPMHLQPQQQMFAQNSSFNGWQGQGQGAHGSF